MAKSLELTDIKIELFTRTLIRDSGVLFEIYDKAAHKRERCPCPADWFIIQIALYKDGTVGLSNKFSNTITIQQLDEIQRVSMLLREM
jgi:hypothetical protein